MFPLLSNYWNDADYIIFHLLQHDYDCYTKKTRPLDIKKRRDSYSGVDGLVKATRRRDVVAAGVASPGKARRYTEFDRQIDYDHNGPMLDRRQSIGVLGERVYIPGSPAMTLPELLAQAEKEVAAEHRLSVGSVKAGLERREKVFQTPIRGKGKAVAGSHAKTISGLRTEVRMRLEYEGEQGWTKDEWKLLDACFTDERLEAGVRLGLGGLSGDGLAPVDFVNVGDVVDRFVEMLGGKEKVETFGEAWSRCVFINSFFGLSDFCGGQAYSSSESSGVAEETACRARCTSNDPARPADPC